ncbi:MAG TPA: hypothetical protein PL085_14810 [Agriterribacter sp.]|nr:hypothetical protein [Agriterribacter sp.]
MKAICFFFYTLSLMLFIISCSKSKDQPDFNLQNLPQPVQEIINENADNCNPCGLTVALCKFRGEMIYEVSVSSPVCNSVIVYYDEKARSHMVTSDIFSEYMETRQRIKTIWSCTP